MSILELIQSLSSSRPRFIRSVHLVLLQFMLTSFGALVSNSVLAGQTFHSKEEALQYLDSEPVRTKFNIFEIEEAKRSIDLILLGNQKQVSCNSLQAEIPVQIKQRILDEILSAIKYIPIEIEGQKEPVKLKASEAYQLVKTIENRKNALRRNEHGSKDPFEIQLENGQKIDVKLTVIDTPVDQAEAANLSPEKLEKRSKSIFISFGINPLHAGAEKTFRKLSKAKTWDRAGLLSIPGGATDYDEEDEDAIAREKTTLRKINTWKPSDQKGLQTMIAEGINLIVVPLFPTSMDRIIDKKYSDLAKTDAERSKYMHDLAQGLFNLHKHGLIHGDIKPGNILMDEEKAVLADFGHTYSIEDRLKEVGKKGKLTFDGARGTYPFMGLAHANKEKISGKTLQEQTAAAQKEDVVSLGLSFDSYLQDDHTLFSQFNKECGSPTSSEYHPCRERLQRAFIVREKTSEQLDLYEHLTAKLIEPDYKKRPGAEQLVQATAQLHQFFKSPEERSITRNNSMETSIETYAQLNGIPYSPEAKLKSLEKKISKKVPFILFPGDLKNSLKVIFKDSKGKLAVKKLNSKTSEHDRITAEIGFLKAIGTIQ